MRSNTQVFVVKFWNPHKELIQYIQITLQNWHNPPPTCDLDRVSKQTQEQTIFRIFSIFVQISNSKSNPYSVKVRTRECGSTRACSCTWRAGGRRPAGRGSSRWPESPRRRWPCPRCPGAAPPDKGNHMYIRTGDRFWGNFVIYYVVLKMT